jgi:hypothetical protein
MARNNAKYNWPAILADGVARGLSVTDIARELGHVNAGQVSRVNNLAGKPIPNAKRGRKAMTFRHETKYKCPAEWGLTPRLAQFVAVLVDAEEPIKRSDLMPLFSYANWEKSVTVALCQARQALAKHNIEIHSIRNVGIFIPDAMKAELRAGANKVSYLRRTPPLERAA